MPAATSPQTVISLLDALTSQLGRIRRDSRRAEILRNMLLLELRTNLSLLNKVRIGKKNQSTNAATDSSTDLELQLTEPNFIRFFLPLIKTEALMAVLILVGEGETLRRRLQISGVSKNFDEIAIGAIRKHQTLSALATLNPKFMTQTRFSVRLGNLQRDFDALLNIVNASKARPWHRRILDLFC